MTDPEHIETDAKSVLLRGRGLLPAEPDEPDGPDPIPAPALVLGFQTVPASIPEPAREPTIAPAPPAQVRWHVAPPGADWADHELGPDCEAHMESASKGEVPFGGWSEVREGD